jgi:hypothetical protein
VPRAKPEGGGGPPGAVLRVSSPSGRCRGRSPMAVGEPPGRGLPLPPGERPGTWGEKQKVSPSSAGEVPRAKPEGGGDPPGRPFGFPPLGGGAEGVARWRWGSPPGRSPSPGRAAGYFGGETEVSPPRGRCRGRSPKAVGEPPGRPGIRVTPGPYLRAMLDTEITVDALEQRVLAGEREIARIRAEQAHRAGRPRSGPGAHRRRAAHPGGLGGGPASTSPQNGPPPHHRRPHPRGAPRGRPPLHRRGHRPRPGRAHRPVGCGRPTRGGGVVRRVGPGEAPP